MKTKIRCSLQDGSLRITVKNISEVPLHVCEDVTAWELDEARRQLTVRLDPGWIPFVGKVEVLGSEARLVRQAVVLPDDDVSISMQLPDVVERLCPPGERSPVQAVRVAGQVDVITAVIAAAGAPLEALGVKPELHRCSKRLRSRATSSRCCQDRE